MATKTPELSGSYTVEKAEHEIGELRGQMAILQEAITQPDTSLTPNIPATGNIQYSQAGHQAYASANGTSFNTGRLTFFTTGNQVVPNSTNVAISGGGTGWSYPAKAGEVYKFAAYLSISPNLGTTGTLRVNLNSTGGLSATRGVLWFSASGGGSGLQDQGTPNPPNNFSWTTGVMGTLNGNYNAIITGVYVLSSAGTVTWQAAAPVSSTQITIASYSHIEVAPITVWSG